MRYNFGKIRFYPLDSEYLSPMAGVRWYWRGLFDALRYAVEYAMLVKNPAELVDLPRTGRWEMAALDLVSVNLLPTLAQKSPYCIHSPSRH